MSRVIRVLQLQAKYAAGVDHVAQMISAALPPEKYQVTMAYLEGEPPAVEESVKLFRFSKRQCRGFRWDVKRELLDYCRAEQFDIVIGHRFKAISALMPVVKKLGIKKAVAVVHGIGDYDRWYRRCLARHYFKKRWQIVAVSDYVRDYLASCSAVFNDDRVRVIPNAVDVDALQASFLPRQAARQAFGLSEDDFVLGAHGRLARVKGYDYLLEAFAPLAREKPNLRLLLIGDGPERKSLSERAVELGVGGQLVLPGYRENASRYLKALDVFVMPSHSEGLSIALLEAMAAALPVIASDIPSIRVTVPCRKSLLPVASVESWRAQIQMIQQVDLKNIGSKSLLKTKEIFDVQNFSKAYRQLLNEAVINDVE